jgi:hypothetical protein
MCFPKAAVDHLLAKRKGRKGSDRPEIGATDSWNSPRPR